MKSIRTLVFVFSSLAAVLSIDAAETKPSDAMSAKARGYWEGGRRLGLYAGMDFGYLFYTQQDRNNFHDGSVVGLKVGYDFFPYLGAELLIRMAGLETTFQQSKTLPTNSYFSFQYIGQVKGAYPVTNRLRFHLGLGGGLYDSSPNMNSAQSKMRGMTYGELGTEYFTRSRGMSIGLSPSVALVRTLKGPIFQSTAFIRYTF